MKRKVKRFYAKTNNKKHFQVYAQEAKAKGRGQGGEGRQGGRGRLKKKISISVCGKWTDSLFAICRTPWLRTRRRRRGKTGTGRRRRETR